MAALKKSGEEDWKKKIPRLNQNICGEKNTVLNSVAADIEGNKISNKKNSQVVSSASDSTAASGEDYN